jgi:transcriptional repressor NrdR
MRCPYCGENRDRVVDSRESRDGDTIRRRRECLACERRFTSYEVIESIPYQVIKNDGRREPFHRQKLMTGLLKACEKRPVSRKQLEAVVEDVETHLHEREEREISSQEIGALMMGRLKGLDPVAYVRFASVYRRFEDVDAFMQALQSLVASHETSPPARADD